MVTTKLHMKCEEVLIRDFIYDIYKFIYRVIFHENSNFNLQSVAYITKVKIQSYTLHYGCCMNYGLKLKLLKMFLLILHITYFYSHIFFFLCG